MSDTISCEFCQRDFTEPGGCSQCQGIEYATCADCDMVCDPNSCAMPACPHKPEETPA